MFTNKGLKVFVSPFRRWSWLFILLVAVGGLIFPKLGLLLLPVMVTLIVMGFYRSKLWCGIICPHGSLFDQFAALISLNKPLPRIFSSRAVQGFALAFFCYMLVQRVLRITELWGTISFWDKFGFIFVVNYLMVTLVGFALAVFIKPRAWCSICPMGTFQSLSYLLGSRLGANQGIMQWITIADKKQCSTCGICAKACPMGLTPYQAFDAKGQFIHSQCISCASCVYRCPKGILGFKTGQGADPGRLNPAS